MLTLLQALTLQLGGKHALHVAFTGLLLIPVIAFAQPPQADSTLTYARAAKIEPASTTTTTTTDPVTPAYPDSIITFEKLDMPIEMEIEFSRLQPKEVLLFRDEFQQMHDGLYGQAIRTIKVWYIDDHIIGYIIEKPFDAGDVQVRKCKINIPVTWCCVPTIEGHGEHCASSLSQLRATEATSKCTGWHIKLPPPIQFNPIGKLQKVKKGKKDQPKDGDFGHTQKTDTKPAKKKKGKQQGFQPSTDTPAGSDSTQAKPLKDSI